MGGTVDEKALFRARTERMNVSQTALGMTLRASEPPATVEDVDPADLPRISLDTREAASISPQPSRRPDLAILSTLGEGGMGRVHLAHQQSLGRDVAVKTLKSDATPSVAHALLREARLTGKLEHPGVIPVHALGVDGDGRPMLVMKRVDGIDLATQLAGRPQTGERLVATLEALMQICRTCEFAHSRGIVHRDIKPENVMIGGFGEVYLLDWGIATTVNAGSDTIVGTPVYMSPEMVLGSAVDARTDVYLLGATLHEVLTGQPRHLGASMLEVARAALLSEPVAYEADVPEELARLCNRATAKSPNDRPQTAAEMREAIALFLRHRAARAIADAARERLRSLEELLGAAALPPKEIARAYRLAAEARFGLAQSLEQDPSDHEARAAIERTSVATIELELRQGHLDTAEALFRDLEKPDAHLEARIAELRAREARKTKEHERLERLDRDLDPTHNAGRRSLPLVAIALVFALMGIYMTTSTGEVTPRALVGAAIPGFLFPVIGIAVLWRRVFTNAFNRRAAGFVIIATLGLLTNRLIGLHVNRPVVDTLTIDLMGFTMLMSCASVMLLRPLWPCAVILGLGLVTLIVVPAIAGPAFIVATFSTLCAGAIILGRARRE